MAILERRWDDPGDGRTVALRATASGRRLLQRILRDLVAEKARLLENFEMTHTIPDWARRGRSGWRYYGQERPDFALAPGPGQESVWDYPRPPRLAEDPREVVVRAGDIEVARTRRSVRVLETASPPTFYLPPDDVHRVLLEPVPGRSLCEWKGEARYYRLALPGTPVEPSAWSYLEPFAEFERIRDHVSFYPGRVQCFVDGAAVQPQPGRFYAGWVTPEIVGPFKGEPGSEGW